MRAEALSSTVLALDPPNHRCCVLRPRARISRNIELPMTAWITDAFSAPVRHSGTFDVRSIFTRDRAYMWVEAQTLGSASGLRAVAFL